LNTTIIIATYNKVDYLKIVLNALEKQTYKFFDIIIADDGSNEKTKTFINNFQKKSSFYITHLWHKDNGFRKCKILNFAISKARGEYLIFMDDDCIPFPDFVETHIRNAKKGYYLSGGAIRLPDKISQKILNMNNTDNIFSPHFLFTPDGLPAKIKYKRFFFHFYIRYLMDIILPIKKTFNGGNSSVFKEDIYNVGGFNEEMGYFAEDIEVGFRMLNNGIKAKRVRHRARMLHLEHKRGYIDETIKIKNKDIVLNVKKKKIIKNFNNSHF
jgi:glycosyltransferase involved in cell wall biosynthesis